MWQRVVLMEPTEHLYLHFHWRQVKLKAWGTALVLLRKQRGVARCAAKQSHLIRMLKYCRQAGAIFVSLLVQGWLVN